MYVLGCNMCFLFISLIQVLSMCIRYTEEHILDLFTCLSYCGHSCIPWRVFCVIRNNHFTISWLFQVVHDRTNPVVNPSPSWGSLSLLLHLLLFLSLSVASSQPAFSGATNRRNTGRLPNSRRVSVCLTCGGRLVNFTGVLFSYFAWSLFLSKWISRRETLPEDSLPSSPLPHQRWHSMNRLHLTSDRKTPFLWECFLSTLLDHFLCLFSRCIFSSAVWITPLFTCVWQEGAYEPPHQQPGDPDPQCHRQDQRSSGTRYRSTSIHESFQQHWTRNQHACCCLCVCLCVSVCVCVCVCVCRQVCDSGRPPGCLGVWSHRPHVWCCRGPWNRQELWLAAT